MVKLKTCFSYLKKFFEKTLAVYKDEQDSIKATVKSIFELLIGAISDLLEKEKGKGADSCQLPEVTSNPSPFNSILLPLIKAIDNLRDK